MEKRFAPQHAIITGGSSGIGKEIAKLLAAGGMNVSIIARTSATLELAKSEIELARRNTHQRVITAVADVANQSEIEQAIGHTIEECGPPQILVASAGVAYANYFLDTPANVFEEMMAVNYFGTLYSVQAVLPSMLAQKAGHLSLISSGAAFMGIYGYGAYGPSKFAVRGLAEVLRCELKPRGISVSIAYPPDTDTPQLEAENKTKPLETKRISGTAKTWSAEAVARCIVRGIEREKFIITPGLEMSLLSRFHSTCAPVINRYFDWIVAKSQQR